MLRTMHSFAVLATAVAVAGLPGRGPVQVTTSPLPCYVAAGEDRTAWLSNDTVTWTTTAMPKLPTAALASDGQRVVAVGGHRITSTTDGTTWTPALRVTGTLTAVAQGKGTWVAVGDLGTVVTSTDGLTWETSEPITSANLLSVATDGTHWVAVGGPTILTSSDARKWTATVTDHELLAVATNGTSWTIVGEDTVATSTTGRRFRFKYQIWNFGVISDPWDNNGFTFPTPDPPAVSASPSVWIAWGVDFWADPGLVFAQSADGRYWSSIEGFGTRPDRVPTALTWDGTRWVALVTTVQFGTLGSDAGSATSGWQIRVTAPGATTVPRFDEWTVAVTDTSGVVPSAIVASCATDEFSG